jgi:flagellar hook-associated protein 3 FlgL
MKVSFVSSQAISQAMRYQMLRMQSDLVKANNEAVTWKVADTGLALGARTGMTISLQRDINRIEGLRDSNELAASRLSGTQLVLKQLTDEANQMLSTFTTALGSPATDQVAQKEAAAFLSTLEGLLNTHVKGEYLFAGINTDLKPFSDFTDPSAANRVAFDTAYEDYFFNGSPLSLGDASEITAVQMETFLATAVDPQFSGPAWNANWSSATNQQIVSRITLSETVETSVSANIEPFRQLSMAAATVAALVTTEMSQAAKTEILNKAVAQLGAAIDGLGKQQGYTGIAEQRIERANERMSMQRDLMLRSINDLEGVDESEAALRVKSLMAQIEISYSLTARMQQMSLLKYL